MLSADLNSKRQRLTAFEDASLANLDAIRDTKQKLADLINTTESSLDKALSKANELQISVSFHMWTPRTKDLLKNLTHR